MQHKSVIYMTLSPLLVLTSWSSSSSSSCCRSLLLRQRAVAHALQTFPFAICRLNSFQRPLATYLPPSPLPPLYSYSPAPTKLAGGFIEVLFKLLVYFSFSAHLRYEKVGLYLCESVCVSLYVCECVCVLLFWCVGVFARQHFRN